MHDLLVIGGGPAGVRAAELAARLGASVALFEPRRLGGTSLNTGSVPSKALIRSATLFAALREGTRLQHPDGRDVPPADLQSRLAAAIVEARLSATIPWSVCNASASTCTSRRRALSMPARSPQARPVPFRKAVVATGAPHPATIPGLAEAPHGRSSLRSVAAPRLAVVGDGPLGCELAGVLSLDPGHDHQDEAKFLREEPMRHRSRTVDGSRWRDDIDTRVTVRVRGQSRRWKRENYRTHRTVTRAVLEVSGASQHTACTGGRGYRVRG
jgi:hypothetical protein